MTGVQNKPGNQPQRWIHADPESGTPFQAALPDPGPLARYPLTISADRRRLLDADGRPFLIQGDAAWSLVANPSYAEAVRYLGRPPLQGIQHHHRESRGAYFLAQPAARCSRPGALQPAG
jgi:hypothetical protein